MDGRVSQGEIRRLVRELLREAVARKSPGKGAPAAAPPSEEGSPFSDRIRRALETGAAIEVRVADDQDLNAFAQSIALCALERDLLGAVASNRVRFRLTGASGGPASTATPAPAPTAAPSRGASRSPGPGGVFHWETGVLSETRVVAISREYTKLVLGPKAVLTPLAKDRARECKLEVVRQKP